MHGRSPGTCGQTARSLRTLSVHAHEIGFRHLGALLGACSFHRNVEFAEKAVDSLVELEPWNPGNYVILSNIYASVDDWDGVARLRKFMKAKEITKAAGYSLIEEGGEVHKFMVGDRSHTRSDDIYSTLGAILATLKPEIKARHDVEYEVLVC
ncbi:hypothetical protein MLD38_000729 [Melastoma candidum]|uniref:Uncharacterized protein n=1 Tax=Melastoma candidum TaxID=119954 RepID=A0ACB9SEY2_9MYRT|nr:hypothetical protein MLD38_000729 [Melastoma candidum]